VDDIDHPTRLDDGHHVAGIVICGTQQQLPGQQRRPAG